MGSVVPWWRRSLERVMEFIQAVLAAPGSRARTRRAGQPRALLPGPEASCVPGTATEEAGPPDPAGLLVPAPAEDLPCDLLLTNGHGAVRLFAAGPLDELSFFQRAGVPAHLEVEFLTRLDKEDAGTEAFKPYGMFRLRPQDGKPLPDPKKDLPESFWAALYREHGLVKLLPASRVLATTFGAWDPRGGSPERGRNRVVAQNPGFNWKRVRGRRYTHADLLELLRRHLPGPERIAWIESAIPDALTPGEIVHRYYLDTGRRLWLVRHHWSRGKSLHKAHTSEEAKRLLVISGALPRRLAA